MFLLALLYNYHNITCPQYHYIVVLRRAPGLAAEQMRRQVVTGTYVSHEIRVGNSMWTTPIMSYWSIRRIPLYFYVFFTHHSHNTLLTTKFTELPELRKAIESIGRDGYVR